jgi:hypothetical protein
MNWTDRVTKWRRLPDREKFLRRWEAIPLDVAQSMAFEREAVDLASLRSLLARIAPPDTSYPEEGHSDFYERGRNQEGHRVAQRG